MFVLRPLRMAKRKIEAAHAAAKGAKTGSSMPVGARAAYDPHMLYHCKACKGNNKELGDRRGLSGNKL